MAREGARALEFGAKTGHDRPARAGKPGFARPAGVGAAPPTGLSAPMDWLVIVLHLFIGATLSGVALVAVLLAGLAGPLTLSGAVLAGFLVAFPVARAVARALRG